VSLGFCSSICAAQTRVDTIYSEAGLDGGITFFFEAGFYVVGSSSYVFGAGDAISVDWEPNSERGYLSFDISLLPTGYGVDSAFLQVWQVGSTGDGWFGRFPTWQVPGGDTIFCIVDHVDYGGELDSIDWTAGDPGDPQTIKTNIGILSRDSVVEYKSMDVTSSLRTTMQLGLKRSEFRIRFPVLTDYDGLNDGVTFAGGEYPPIIAPRLVVASTLTSTDIEMEHPLEVSLSQNFPNPFNPSTTIRYELPKKAFVTLSVYNVLGEEVATLVKEEKQAGSYQVQFDGIGLASGVYFYRLNTDGRSLTEKMALIR
jgi:hypothetical protein